MYSMVMMAALATSPVVPDCHRHACHGCYGGCYGCYGGCYGGGYYGGCYGGGYYGGCYGGGCYGGGYYGAAPAAPPAEKKKMPEGAAAAPARIIVQVPAGAKVFIDGAPTSSTSDVRTFVTPDLERNMAYTYTVRVEVTRDGAPVSESKRVQMTAGSLSRLSFTGIAVAAKEGGKTVASAGR